MPPILRLLRWFRRSADRSVTARPGGRALQGKIDFRIGGSFFLDKAAAALYNERKGSRKVIDGSPLKLS